MENVVDHLKIAEIKLKSLRDLSDQMKAMASASMLFSLQWSDIQSHFDLTKSGLMKKAEEIGLQEKRVLEMKELVEERDKRVGIKLKRYDECQKDIPVKEEQLKLLKASISECDVELSSKEKQLTSVRKELAECSKELLSKIDQLGDEQKKLQECNEDIDARKKRAREIEVREKEQKETQGKRARVIEMREQKVNESERTMKMKVEVEECEGRVVVKDRIMKRAKEDQYWKSVNLVGLQLSGIVSLVKGKELQVFLNKNSEYHDKMGEKLASSLRLVPDPAKLILDGLEGFYPLKKGKVEFEGCVVKRSCNLLLEQLMKVSPIIKPHVRAEAMKLEVQWRKKMRIDAGYYLEVLAYLLLVASYGLDCGFNTRMLLSCLETVAAYNNAPSLIRLLGLKNVVPDVIRNLIAKKQQVEAIKFIFAFELIKEFEPGPLLKMYLKDSEEALVEATRKRARDLRTVVRCIEEYARNSPFGGRTLSSVSLWCLLTTRSEFCICMTLIYARK